MIDLLDILLMNLFHQQGIEVIRVEHASKHASSGLLHEPVNRYVVYSSTGIFCVVCKLITFAHTPDMLFERMYSNCLAREKRLNLDAFREYNEYLSMRHMPQREQFFYQHMPDALKELTPRYWGIITEESKQYIVMEDLSNYKNMDMIENPNVWSYDTLLQVMMDLAHVHKHLQQFRPYIQHEFDYEPIQQFLYSFHNQITFHSGVMPDEVVHKAGNQFISDLTLYEIELSHDAVVIHNDFNIRNMCFSDSKKHIKLFDWEFWDIDSPVKDILDLLLSLNPNQIDQTIVDNLLQKYIDESIRITGSNLRLSDYKKMLYYVALKYSATRMNMYLLCYHRNRIPYIVRMYRNLSTIIQMYKVVS